MDGAFGHESSTSRKEYDHLLHDLQVEFVKLQRHFIACGDRILAIFQGPDAAGTDGTIKRIVEHSAAWPTSDDLGKVPYDGA